MRKPRKALVGVVVTLLSAAVAFAVPAGSAFAGADGSGSPVATQSKKKCKKGKRKKCKKKGGGAAYAQGRYSGTYAETGGTLYFTVLGGRLYTEGRDAFAVDARCSDGSTDFEYGPVQASINNGTFAASGNWPLFGGGVIPWRVSGQIGGMSVSNGVFSIGPYNDFNGNSCSGTVHFSAQWCLVAASCVYTPVIPIIIFANRPAEN
jgi:hypothetical protein